MKRLALAAMVSVWAAPAALSDAALDTRLVTLLASYQADYGFPGATVAYVLPDGTIGDAAIGMADAEAGVPMTPASRMLAASIGKTLVGALVLSLESDGVLRRADLLSDHLGDQSWFPHLPNASRITIGHLLTHTAGLPDHVYLPAFAEALASQDSPTAEDAIAFVLDTAPLFEPGSAWAYTDTGYLLLGLAIEAATGRDYYQLVKERFLDPLALSQTSPSTTPSLEGLAVGYTAEGNPFGLPSRTMDADGALLWNPAIEWTGGGFASTSYDLARWGHALFTGAAMPAPYLDRLLDAVPVHPDAPGILYGSGVAIYAETPFGAVHGHGGWVPGYVSSLRHYADHDLTIAFQINSDVGTLDDSSDLVQVMEAGLAQFLLEQMQQD